jgi:Domain of unknown function (DUF4258)
MFKKYLPYIVLLLAGYAFLYIRTHQRNSPKKKIDVTIPVLTDLDRTATQIIYSKHAQCRMACRHIDESEVKEIYENGILNSSKIQEDERGKTYPLEGQTHDHQNVRIVFAPKSSTTVEVVTCIDLDTEWPCDCK